MLKDFDVSGNHDNVRDIIEKLSEVLMGESLGNSIHALGFIVAVILEKNHKSHAEMMSACARFAGLALSIADDNRKPTRSN